MTECESAVVDGRPVRHGRLGVLVCHRGCVTECAATPPVVDYTKDGDKK